MGREHITTMSDALYIKNKSIEKFDQCSKFSAKKPKSLALSVKKIVAENCNGLLLQEFPAVGT